MKKLKPTNPLVNASPTAIGKREGTRNLPYLNYFSEKILSAENSHLPADRKNVFAISAISISPKSRSDTSKRFFQMPSLNFSNGLLK